jgi:hypothetical protein
VSNNCAFLQCSEVSRELKMGCMTCVRFCMQMIICAMQNNNINCTPQCLLSAEGFKCRTKMRSRRRIILEYPVPEEIKDSKYVDLGKFSLFFILPKQTKKFNYHRAEFKPGHLDSVCFSLIT